MTDHHYTADLSDYTATLDARRELLDTLHAVVSHDDGYARIVAGGYVAVDDGQSRWVVAEDDYTDAVEEIAQEIVEGKWDKRIEADSADVYQALCDKTGMGTADWWCDLPHSEDEGRELLAEIEDPEDRETIARVMGIDLEEVTRG